MGNIFTSIKDKFKKGDIKKYLLVVILIPILVFINLILIRVSDPSAIETDGTIIGSIFVFGIREILITGISISIYTLVSPSSWGWIYKKKLKR